MGRVKQNFGVGSIVSLSYLLKHESSRPGKRFHTGDMETGSIELCVFTFLALFAPSQLWAQNLAEGKKLYAVYCSGCHGDTGKGDGPAARSLPVKPADHTDGNVMNQLSDKFLEDIIAKGGPGVGKSSFMPAWGTQLNEKQLRAIVSYVRSIAEPPYNKPGGK